jgi:UDP-glucose 4-epimerase
MTVLVTGSAGHLGEALMRTFNAQGQTARGVDIKPSSFTHCVGSITDRGVVRRCMAGMRAVIHAATLHKPHVATHSYQDFLDINVTGTLVLLEEAVKAGVESFVFTSTTSTFGAALTPARGEPAAWVTEDVLPIPKNIYGASKVAAEGLCELFARQHRLPTIVLRTSRFFPEADDDEAIRDAYEPANAQANELLNRRADIADVVDAHILAAERAKAIGFRALHRLGHDTLRRGRSSVAAPGRGGRRAEPFPRLPGALRQTRLAALPDDRPGLCEPAGIERAWVAAKVRFP